MKISSCQSGRRRRSQSLAAAANLYRGELLPGHYEEWLLPERERLAEEFLLCVSRLVRILEQMGDLPGALRLARLRLVVRLRLLAPLARLGAARAAPWRRRCCAANALIVLATTKAEIASPVIDVMSATETEPAPTVAPIRLRPNEVRYEGVSVKLMCTLLRMFSS